MIESALQLPVKTEPVDEPIARLCRQICLCRARGQTVEASRVENILRHHLTPDFSTETLQQIFFAEQRRVIDALMLVELLGPLLVERFAIATSGKRVALTPSVGGSPSPAGRAAPSDIADLIEGMLEQERARSDA